MDAMAVLDGLSLASKRRTIAPSCETTYSTPSLSFTKKLKRMPHLFTRVLELPFHADTSVKVVESRDSYAFVARLPGLVGRGVKAEVMEIVPGATKVVIRGVEGLLSNLEDSEVDLWRFRLPPTTIPEESVASYEHEVLVVTIPKAPVSCDDNVGIDGKNDGDCDILLHEADPVDDIEDIDALSDDRRFSDDSDKDAEFETEEERMQREVLDDLESFGSPRRTSFGSPRRTISGASCTQSYAEQSTGSQDLLRSFGSWMGGFAIFVQ